MEEWKIITDFPGYQISNQGRVRRAKASRRLGYQRILSQKLDKDGYFQIHLSHNNESFHRTVHRLVAEAFIPRVPNKLTVDHIDGKPTNNCVENLRWEDSLGQANNRRGFETNTGEKYISIIRRPDCYKDFHLTIARLGIRKLFYTLEDAIEARDEILSTA
jgi:hypothetical protein